MACSLLHAGSSLEDVARVYVDSIGYDLSGGSVGMCEVFIAACRILQLRRPTSVTVDGNPVAFDYKAIAGHLKRAEIWISTNRPSNVGGANESVRTYDMSGVRD